MSKLEQNDFLKIIQLTPLVSIDLILEDDKENVLLGKRTNRPARGAWFVPGGRINKNESLSAAFKRISLKEIGIELDIENAILLGAFDHIYQDNFIGVKNINTHYVALGYKLQLDNRSDLKFDDQHSEVKWWSKNKLLNTSVVHENTKRYFQIT